MSPKHKSHRNSLPQFIIATSYFSHLGSAKHTNTLNRKSYHSQRKLGIGFKEREILEIESQIWWGEDWGVAGGSTIVVCQHQSSPPLSLSLSLWLRTVGADLVTDIVRLSDSLFLVYMTILVLFSNFFCQWADLWVSIFLINFCEVFIKFVDCLGLYMVFFFFFCLICVVICVKFWLRAKIGGKGAKILRRGRGGVANMGPSLTLPLPHQNPAESTTPRLEQEVAYVIKIIQSSRWLMIYLPMP